MSACPVYSLHSRTSHNTDLEKEWSAVTLFAPPPTRTQIHTGILCKVKFQITYYNYYGFDILIVHALLLRGSSGTYKLLTFKGPENCLVLNLGILTQAHWKIEVTPL